MDEISKTINIRIKYNDFVNDIGLKKLNELMEKWKINPPNENSLLFFKDSINYYLNKNYDYDFKTIDNLLFFGLDKDILLKLLIDKDILLKYFKNDKRVGLISLLYFKNDKSMYVNDFDNWIYYYLTNDMLKEHKNLPKNVCDDLKRCLNYKYNNILLYNNNHNNEFIKNIIYYGFNVDIKLILECKDKINRITKLINKFSITKFKFYVRNYDNILDYNYIDRDRKTLYKIILERKKILDEEYIILKKAHYGQKIARYVKKALNDKYILTNLRFNIDKTKYLDLINI
jgi:hypothetical protein